MEATSKQWALILGGSSGMGLATAKKLASHGQPLILVHRDRRATMKELSVEFEKLSTQTQLITINQNALSPEGRADIIAMLKDKLSSDKIGLVLHSIALGNLRPAAPQEGLDGDILKAEDFSQTIAYMGYDLLLWIQDLFKEQLLAEDTRVIGLTSEGNTKAWHGYAAVSAAKCALESISRTIAKEFAPYGLRSNIIQAGITETPALKLIPGYEDMIRSATERNPYHRLTQPSDVANVVYLLSRPEASWINGTLIHVDGGEHIS